MGSNWWLINHTLKELPQNIWALPDKTGHYRLLDNVSLASAVHNLSLVNLYLPWNKRWAEPTPCVQDPSREAKRLLPLNTAENMHNREHFKGGSLKHNEVILTGTPLFSLVWAAESIFSNISASAGQLVTSSPGLFGVLVGKMMKRRRKRRLPAPATNQGHRDRWKPRPWVTETRLHFLV